MGIYFGYDNLAPDATWTSPTEATDYEVTRLAEHRLMPAYRSAAKCVTLDGAADYFWIADAAWNSYTSDFCFEFLAKPAVVDTSSSDDHIIDKWGAAGQRSYKVVQNDDDLLVYLSSDGTNTAATVTFAAVFAVQWDRLKLSYDASDQDLALYIDGAESGRATITAVTGTAAISGTVPASIHDGTARLTIGSNYDESGNFWAGSLGLNGFDNAENDNGGYLNPTSCDAYYDFDDSDGTDSSGNARDLTAVSLDSSDYSDCTAYLWIGGTITAADPTFLVLDRRHNLSTGATVRVLTGDWFSSYSSAAYESSVTAGEPVVLTISGSSDTQHWLEIHDPDNTDGYISIPYVFLGAKTTFSGDPVLSIPVGECYWGNIKAVSAVQSLAGNYRTGVKSNSRRAIRATLTNINVESADFTALAAIAEWASDGKPVVFCYDDSDEGEHARVYWWNNAADFVWNIKAGSDSTQNEVYEGQIELIELAEPA